MSQTPMICARAWDPSERTYHRLSIMNNGELWYSWKPMMQHPIPEDWITEWGFMNSSNEPIYHGDVLEMSWIDGPVTVVHYAANKNAVPMFLFDSRPPEEALSQKYKTTCFARPAFVDTRITNKGSWREPRTVYEDHRPPKPKPAERLDIIGHIAKRGENR
jgi:hypothetical protein